MTMDGDDEGIRTREEFWNFCAGFTFVKSSECKCELISEDARRREVADSNF